jgi:hypothetical protein
MTIINPKFNLNFFIKIINKKNVEKAIINGIRSPDKNTALK